MLADRWVKNAMSMALLMFMMLSNTACFVAKDLYDMDKTLRQTNKNYEYEPSIIQRAKVRAIEKARTDPNPKIDPNTNVPLISEECITAKPGYIYFPCLDVSVATVEIKVTDQDVVELSDALENALSQRNTTARRARLLSATIQITTAAAAASLAALGGPISAVTALGATSALMPEFQGIFHADKRADAYVQGVDFIKEAQASYFEATNGSIDRENLTTHGAKLHSVVVNTMKTVEKVVLGTIPTTEELQKATGKYKDPVFSLYPNKLAFANNALPAGGTINLAATGNHKVVKATSNNPTLLTATVHNDAVQLALAGTLPPLPAKAEVLATNQDGFSNYFNLVVAQPLVLKSGTVDFNSPVKLPSSPALLTITCDGNELLYDHIQSKVIKISRIDSQTVTVSAVAGVLQNSRQSIVFKGLLGESKTVEFITP